MVSYTSGNSEPTMLSNCSPNGSCSDRNAVIDKENKPLGDKLLSAISLGSGSGFVYNSHCYMPD